jgi:hypothetical protein
MWRGSLSRRLLLIERCDPGRRTRGAGPSGHGCRRGHRLVGRRFQPIEDHFEANIAIGNPGLIDVIQLQGLGQGEYLLLAVVAGQRVAECLQRRVAA